MGLDMVAETKRCADRPTTPPVSQRAEGLDRWKRCDATPRKAAVLIQGGTYDVARDPSRVWSHVGVLRHRYLGPAAVWRTNMT